MDRITDILLTDLRHLVADLGKGGGMISPSIYDTAQVLRMAPPAEDVWPAINWLLEQQQPDGGWGNPAVPLARDLSTLAAVLALQAHSQRKTTHAAIQAGLAFLRRQAHQWEHPLPDDLPVGIELLLPCLLEEAASMGLQLSHEPYASLVNLGNRRRRMIAQLPLQAGTTAVHSWEAFGTVPDPTLIDGSGGIGHSPAATAAWLRAAAGQPDLADACASARHYLEQAAAATGVNIPGVVPTAWPITRFEQSFALYALVIAALIDHPALQAVIKPQIADLALALRSSGLGYSDFFVADGDDTAVALGVLQATGAKVDHGMLKQYQHDTHFCTYFGELQPSLSVTARAVHTLRLMGIETNQPQTYLIEHQQADGRWSGDKWNGSWICTTCQILIALNGSGQNRITERGIQCLLDHQHLDGGWGTSGSANEETAYVVLTLRALRNQCMFPPVCEHALQRAEQWMRHEYRPFHQRGTKIWVAKETYRPERFARAIELAATFPQTPVIEAD